MSKTLRRFIFRAFLWVFILPLQFLVIFTGWIDSWLDRILGGLEDLDKDIKNGWFD